MNIVTEWMISHALFLLLSAGSVFNVIWLTTFRNRLQMKMGAVLIVSILHTVFGVMAVRLFAFAEGGFDSSKGRKYEFVWWSFSYANSILAGS